ncbi:hypothetical protein V1512DRAFT_264660 [Lipomyces arxii]|uniref:uncharacterized protein n=1 Tax=Lipomyces arxii TaxID=56418 RepID=UPI0034CDD295
MALPVTALPELTTPVFTVTIDSGVLLKISKHTSESFPATVCGMILGLDEESVLQVTHAFPFPSSENSEDSASPRSKANIRYQTDMIRQLQEVNIETNPVGYYMSSYMGGFYNQTLVDNLVAFQAANPNSIVLVHDVTRSTQGSFSLKAYRLSAEFLATNKTSGGKFSSDIVVKNNLTYLDILEELPITVKNSHLSIALLQSLDSPKFTEKKSPASLAQSSSLTPNFDSLDLAIDPYLEKNVEFLIDSVDDYYAEQGTFNYFQRQLAREQSKVQQWIQKTVSENQLREKANLPLLSEDDWHKHFKLPTEPSRLDNLLISAQINQYCNQIEEYSSVVSSKLFATQNGLGA